MSKIGRKAINLNNVQVNILGKEIKYKGPFGSDTYILPDSLDVVIENNQLKLIPPKNYESMPRKMKRKINQLWGLNRALLANQIQGATQEFLQKIEINGLGYKASKVGNKLEFNLGYSHKIDFVLPENVLVEVDRSGKKLTVKSSNKFLLGKVCSGIKLLRLPEPYKGTGIKLENEKIRRKAGKTKAA